MPVPALSPIRIETLLCYGCSREMRYRVAKMANGKPLGITYFCDTCQYAFEKIMEHATGTISKYVAPEGQEKSVAKKV